MKHFAKQHITINCMQIDKIRLCWSEWVIHAIYLYILHMYVVDQHFWSNMVLIISVLLNAFWLKHFICCTYISCHAIRITGFHYFFSNNFLCQRLLEWKCFGLFWCHCSIWFDSFRSKWNCKWEIFSSGSLIVMIAQIEGNPLALTWLARQTNLSVLHESKRKDHNMIN